jgi:hypothetical protein
MFQITFVRKTKTAILLSITTFFGKSYYLGNNEEKCGKAGKDTGDNMARAHCMLGNYGYRHTLRICNTY